MNPRPAQISRRAAAFTLMEVMVVIAIILVLAAIVFPVYRGIQMRANKTRTLQRLTQITGACLTYAGQNNFTLPAEDAPKQDTWQNAAKPDSMKTWYNALPKLLGHKSVGEYAANPREFYTNQNILYLQGAQYPEDDSKLRQPLFAFAINTKLHRKNADGKKEDVMLPQITHPSKTVLFLEQGLPKEEKASQAQPKYDGSCKGSAKSFVARYGGEGILAFADGHAESHSGKEILTESGAFPWPQIDIVWTRTPEEDPNKSN
jgi:prepilin-type N-terminal cleavage/methylation domain-containing protein/prepilin-type processing-associated H-X9-DG protein